MSNEFMSQPAQPYISTDTHVVAFGATLKREVRKETLTDDVIVYMDGNEPLALAPNFDYIRHYAKIFEEQLRNGQQLGNIELHYTATEFLEALRDRYVVIDVQTQPFIWHNRNGRVLTFNSALVAGYVIKIHVHESPEDKETAIRVIGV